MAAADPDVCRSVLLQQLVDQFRIGVSRWIGDEQHISLAS